VDAEDKIGGTPLSYAVCNGRKEVLKPLLVKGTLVGSADDIIKRLFLSAVEKGHDEIIKLLLETGKVDIDGRDEYGRTPLMWAARNGHEAIVKLLEKRADRRIEDGHSR
jgi:ankyrin repeat protein